MLGVGSRDSCVSKKRCPIKENVRLKKGEKFLIRMQVKKRQLLRKNSEFNKFNASKKSTHKFNTSFGWEAIMSQNNVF